MAYLEFLSPGKKIRNIRNMLNIKQIELEQIGVSRNFISMVESDKRNLSEETFLKLIEYFKNKALLQGIELDFNETNLLLSEIEEAEIYCDKKLKSNISSDEIDEVINIAEKYNLVPILSKCYILKGNYLYETKKYRMAFIFYNKTLEIYISNKNDSAKPFIYNKLGKCRLMEMNFEEALSYFLKCLFFSNELLDTESAKNCLYNIALVYKKMGDFDNSLKYINQFLDICNPNDNFHEYIGGLILKSNCYLEKSENEMAVNMLNDILNKYYDRLGPLLGYIYNSLGLIYFKLDLIALSLEYFDMAINIRQNTDMSNLSHTLIDKSRVYIKQKLYSEAILLLQRGLAVARKFYDKEYILISYSLLEEVYILITNTEKLEQIYLEVIKLLSNSDVGTDVENLIDAYIKLSTIYLENKKYDKCKDILQKIKKINKSK